MISVATRFENNAPTATVRGRARNLSSATLTQLDLFASAQQQQQQAFSRTVSRGTRSDSPSMPSHLTSALRASSVDPAGFRRSDVSGSIPSSVTPSRGFVQAALPAALEVRRSVGVVELPPVAETKLSQDASWDPLAGGTDDQGLIQGTFVLALLAILALAWLGV